MTNAKQGIAISSKSTWLCMTVTARTPLLRLKILAFFLLSKSPLVSSWNHPLLSRRKICPTLARRNQNGLLPVVYNITLLQSNYNKERLPSRSSFTVRSAVSNNHCMARNKLTTCNPACSNTFAAILASASECWRSSYDRSTQA